MKITCGSDVIKSSSFASLLSDNVKQENDRLNDEEFSVEKNEGSYFGEWVLLDEKVISLSATAVGDVICLVITKEKFESAIGPLAKLSQNDRKYVRSSQMNASTFSIPPRSITFQSIDYYPEDTPL